MKENEKLSLEQISERVNNVNIDRDVLAFDMEVEMQNLSFPMRFDGLLLMLVSEGEGSIGIDMRQYELRRDTLIVLHPRNYVYSARTEGLRMDIVACSMNVVENVLPKLTDLLPLLMHHRAEPVELLGHEDAARLREFYTFLRKLMSESDSVFARKKVMCLLQAALFEMMDIHCRENEISEHQRTRKEEIMAKFILMVSENFRKERQVSFYAEQLCVSSKHLSAVVKEISGKTAREWIENYVTVEAKVLLRSTDLTIQEVASRLNFSNQSFFGKYFKHQTGLSPSEYRKTEK